MSSRPKRKAVTDSEVKAKKLRGETDLCDGLHWSNVGTDSKGVCPLLITLTSDSLEGRSKVASFDIDFTIIKTASGRKFATGPKDWTFWDPSVTEKLKALDKDGHRIVFFTNQGGIEKLKVTPEGFKDKIEDILKQLGIPVLVFASTGNNQYRKPSTSMWDYFEEKCNKGVKVKKDQSIYVGDAAGRKKGWAKDKPKDFSCSDRMFAANIGIKFATPEEFFLGEKPVPFQWGSLDPNKFLSSNPPAVNNKTAYASKKQELIVMVGQPASGKSTFSKRYLVPHGYTTVNRDTLGTMEKCVKIAKEALEKGKSVVSDNTNPSVDGRAKFINLAKEKGVPCRCLWLQTPNDLSHHLNLYRQTLTKGQVRRIPDVGYNVFKKNFEEPTTSEGFSEVIKVQFQPEFDSKTDEQLFRKWTV